MYIITSGQCKKEIRTREADGDHLSSKVKTETLHMGTRFGMMAFFYACPYSATVTAATQVEVLSVSYDELLEICREDGEGEAILANITKSMKKFLLKQLD